MLTGNEIRIQIESGGIVIYPYDEKCIGPNSYDVHLGDSLVVYTEAVLDARLENRTMVLQIPEGGIVLRPGRLYLGKTAAQAAWGYLTKHLVAIRDMVERDDFSNRADLLEKCKDSINYICFIWCIGNEKEG